MIKFKYSKHIIVIMKKKLKGEPKPFYKRIYKIGGGSHFVLIPREWIKTHKLEEGDQILGTMNDELRFYPDKIKKEQKKNEGEE